MDSIAFVHEGLGNSSYLVPTGAGEALVVDPDRNVGRYLAHAEMLGLSVTRVLETHLHADFVTGARELQRVGATVFAPAGGGVRYPHYALADGDTLAAGDVRIEVIGSPGHTPEHLAFAAGGGGHAPTLFSGGSLIVGGAARTDLVSPGLSGQLTRLQYRSVTQAFRAFADDTLLKPTHGAGSFCSTGAGGQRSSTLGEERRSNPIFNVPTEEEFVRWFPGTFPAAPSYFFRLRAVNQLPRLRAEIRPPANLEPAEFRVRAEQGLVVDTRPQSEFMHLRIPGSISVAFRDAFAIWLGWLVDPSTPLYFVLGNEPIEDVTGEAMLVGLEDFAGVLRGGISAWEASGYPVRSSGLVSAARAAEFLAAGAIALDVREPDEYTAGHLPGAVHIPLGQLQTRARELPHDRPLVAYCGHGERSATGLSILERAGFGPLMNLDLGIDGWTSAGLPVDPPRRSGR
ncbi:MAG TPA: rhodanese-like domain-containing protein [Tepidiformaceae bacterium]|nr:rhodanese-like domain-containing protein [Tepidiformaceae bacterium]